MDALSVANEGVLEYRPENEGVTGGVPRPREPRLMDEVRHRIRLRHSSVRTGQAYTGWIRRFILANGKRHPRELGALEAERFLSGLAMQSEVAASTRNPALQARLRRAATPVRHGKAWHLAAAVRE